MKINNKSYVSTTYEKAIVRRNVSVHIVKQKIVGALILALNIAIIACLKDILASIILIPIALYLIFTKEVVDF